MKPSILMATLAARFESHRAGRLTRGTYVEGLPGCGKTQIARQVAESLGIGYIPIHAPTMQPEDYGFPVVTAERDSVNFLVPMRKFPFVGSDCPEYGFSMWDETGQCGPAEQKILANALQEREIHGQKFKPGWHILMTGNPITARAGSNRLLSHFEDRMTTYTLDVDMDDLCTWGINNNVPVEIIAFWRFKPDLICDFDPQRRKNATPRGWVEGVGASLGNVPPEAEYDTFCGDVGEGAAAVFKGFINVFRKLPNPDAALLSPKTAEVPTDSPTLYALAGAIAHRASKANFDRVMTYTERWPPEFEVLVVRDSVKRCPDVQHTKAFIQWASGRGAKILM